MTSVQATSPRTAFLAPTSASPGAADAPHAKPTPLEDAASKPGSVRTETLPNGVRIVIAERPGAAATKFQVGIGAGSFQDPAGKLGMAHMLEHLSFEGSPTRTAPQQELLRSKFGNNWNAWTNQSEVVFWGIIPGKQAKLGAELVTDMFQHPATTGKRVPQERAAVENEMVYWDGTLAGQKDDLQMRLLYGDTAATNNVIGTRKSVDTITSTDLQDFHKQYFVGRNTIALIDGDPKHLELDTIRRELGKLPAGARVDNTQILPEVVKGRALQVVNEDTSGTVDLNVMLPVSSETLDAAGSAGTIKLLTSALNSRLNDRLRRNDHLTYGVSAKLEPAADNQSVLHVTTNVAAPLASKALEDIVATLTDARDGFGPKTLEKDRTELLSRLRTLDPTPAPTTSDIADAAFTDALYHPGISVPTAADLAGPSPRSLAASIGKVTGEQFAHAASSLVDLANLKVLAIGNLGDGGAQLLSGLEAAGIGAGTVQLNPVSLATYRDMGIAVPRNSTPPVKPAAADKAKDAAPAK